MEVAVRMESLGTDTSPVTVMIGQNFDVQIWPLVINFSVAGRFSMVCRDASTKKARQVNPLMYNTPEEKALYDLGERKSIS